MSLHALISCTHLQREMHRYHDRFVERGITYDCPDFSQQLVESELLEIIERYDGVIAGDDELTAKVIERGDRLRVIAKWGIGMDGIAIDAARERGIEVCNTPDLLSEEVADVAIGYAVMLARELHKIDQAVRAGEWYKPRGISLGGKTIGLIGAGGIGRAVLRRAHTMGMELLASDPAPLPAEFVQQTGVEQLAIDNLLERADFIVLTCALTPHNRHMLSTEQFSRAKPGSYLINVARGPLIDETALIEALRENRFAGAALDVFEEEPLAADHPLRGFDNCIFGSHNSSNTIDAVLRVNEAAIANLFKGLGLKP